jgi:hypothetical protein
MPRGSITCRLCDGLAEEKFQLSVLGKYTVGYYECSICGSLQSEPPYWLGESYSLSLASLDVGAANRVNQNLAAVFSVSRILGVKSILDFGGGDGLLCRNLRDLNIEAYVYDKYATAIYAQQFERDLGRTFDLITAFEVAEHMAEPASEMGALFESRPRYIFLTTVLYDGQGADWWYMAPESGQHIFFYSAASLDHIARKFGYVHYVLGKFILFAREPIPSLKLNMLRAVLRVRSLKLVFAALSLVPRPGIESDFQTVRKLIGVTTEAAQGGPTGGSGELAGG